MIQRVVGLALAGLLIPQTSAAFAQSSIKQGLLTCRTSASIGLIVGSTQRLRCQFQSDRGWTQYYEGRINRVGLDLGVTAGGIMSWAVVGSSNAISPGALTGKFIGASGDASLGLGVGANALVGGTRNGISLQPLSVEGQVGINLALGVAGLSLRPVGQAR